MFIGSFSSVFYILNINEVRLCQEAKDYDVIYKREVLGEVKPADSLIMAKGKDMKAWLTDANFYIHGMVYMVVRVAVNVTMTV